MGHKINPLIFRLGNSNNWQYNLKEKKNWTTSFLIYQLVSNQMMKYTTPYFNRTVLRNNRLDSGLVTMEGENQLIKNNFIKKSILFSHLILGSANSNLEISCFFYDYRFSNPSRYSQNRNRIKEFSKYNQLYSNIFFRWKAKASLRFFKRFLKLYRFRYRLKKRIKKLKPNLWFLNLNWFTIWSGNPSRMQLKTKLFKLLKVFLRIFSGVNQSYSKKKKLFFFNVFSTMISNGFLKLLKLLGMKQLTNRLVLMLIEINLLNLNHKLRLSQFFSELFKNRYFLFKGVSKSIGQNLKSMLPLVNKVTIKYHAIRERSMTSSLLTNLIIVKLGQYFRINSIIYPLTNWIKRHKNVLGYRIIISGRLTRRERASHIIKSGRSMPLSSYKRRIDYYQDVKIMKFGMVGIKVYLFLKKKLRNSYYYFKFQID